MHNLKTKKRIKKKKSVKTYKNKLKQVDFLNTLCNTQNNFRILFCVQSENSFIKNIPLFEYKQKKDCYIFQLHSKLYKISFDYKLGTGSYGSIWKSNYMKDEMVTDIVVKKPTLNIKKNNFLKEMYIHLFLFCNHSSTTGYIPEIKVVFRTNSTNVFYGMEILDGTLWDFIDDNIENPYTIYVALHDIVSFLQDLQNKYKFMHRDFHPGNIMYKKKQTHYKWYFIDFNMCFLKINNKFVNQMTTTNHYHVIHNFNSSHDIRMLFLYLYEHYMNRLPIMLLHYMLGLFTEVSYYFPIIKQNDSREHCFTCHSYGDIVDKYDTNFTTQNISQNLKKMILNTYSVTKIQANLNTLNMNIFDTYIHTSRNLLNLYL